MASTSYDVLIVDDDPAAVRLIAKIVSKAGHTARSVANGCLAMEQVRTACPDLVISDWEMPGMDGPTLCRAIRAEPLPKYVGVVLLTARTAEAEVIEGLEAGADDFLSKPIKPQLLLARLHAATRILEMERRLRDASQHDPLTGLLNRRTLHEQLVSQWDQASRHDHPLACVMFDLDFFKRVNDTYGHLAGDAVLRAVAGVLCRNPLASETCRFGGEEFCVVLPETDEAVAAKWAEDIRAALARLAVTFHSQSIRVTASFGVAQRLADMTGPETLLCLADEALAIAKQTGRNRVVRQSSIDDPTKTFSAKSASLAPLDQVLARDIMIPASVCPHVDDTVSHVADLLLQLRLNSAPVVDSDGKLVGIISEIDLARATVSGRGWSDPIQVILAGDVITFDEDSSAKHVFDFMLRASLRRVVIVRDGKPIGVISRACFVRWLRNWFTLRERTPCLVAPTFGAGISQRRAAETLACVENRIAELRVCLGDNTAEFVPSIVTQATQLQELADEILGLASSECGIGAG